METIAAISTPNAPGGIAMIRISGGGAVETAARVFVPKSGRDVRKMAGNTCCYGEVCDGETTLDDAVLTIFRAPKSYTGEDTAEITCHGGVYVSQQILKLILQNGARMAQPGEFTRRAFLNGKMSLTEAEAVADVIASDGAASLKAANLARQGRLGRAMRGLSDKIISLLGALAYWMDDPEESPPELEPQTLLSRVEEIRDALADCAARYENGRILRQGVQAVLLGAPNAGKSSVMNWLCGENRSIVTQIPGTTRDIITETVRLGDFTLVLSDTAGLREAQDPIETIGVEQALRCRDEADLILYVVDAQKGLTGADREVLAACGGKPRVLLWNKTDLCPDAPPELGCSVLRCAAPFETETRGLEEILRTLFDDAFLAQGQVFAMTERQQSLIVRAREAMERAAAVLTQGGETDMLYMELQDAADALRELDGESVSEAVLDDVFSRFCVGK